MRGASALAFALVAALGLLAAPASAQRVTIEAEQAPLSHVLAELAKQTGVGIYNEFRERGQDPLVTVVVQEVPLGTVLRQVAEQCGGHATGGPRQYWLYASKSPADRLLTVAAGGYGLRLGSITISSHMQLSVITGEPEFRGPNMTLGVSVLADDDLDLLRIEGIGKDVRAVDNRGRLIAWDPAEAQGRLELRPERLDIVRVWGALTLPPPKPGATSLTAIKGDLIAHKEVRDVKFVVPLDKPEVSVSGSGCTLDVKVVGRRLDGTYGHAYVLRTTLTLPDGEDGWQVRPRDPEWGRGVVVSLENEDRSSAGSQTRYLPLKSDDPRQVPHEFAWHLDKPAQEPARLVYRVTIVGGGQERLPFRFDNIPLPTWEE